MTLELSKLYLDICSCVRDSFVLQVAGIGYLIVVSEHIQPRENTEKGTTANGRTIG